MLYRIYSLLATTTLVIALSACSSNPPSLGLIDGKFVPCPNKPNCVSSEASDTSQQVNPIILPMNSEQAVQHITETLKELEAQNIQVKGHYIRAEFVSTVFRFVDDLEIYLEVAQNEKNLSSVKIHVRSASRTGYSDFGVNRERVEELTSLLKK